MTEDASEAIRLVDEQGRDGINLGHGPPEGKAHPGPTVTMEGQTGDPPQPPGPPPPRTPGVENIARPQPKPEGDG